MLKEVPKLNQLCEIFGESFKEMDHSKVAKDTYFPGGETEGLKRLQRKVSDQLDYVCKFKKPETSSITSPASIPAF